MLELGMHPLLLLAVATFVLVIGFLVWNLISTRQRHKTGGNTTGVGGPNDPLAGANNEIRSGNAMAESMDAANATQDRARANSSRV